MTGRRHRGSDVTPEEACRQAEDYRVHHRIRLDAALLHVRTAGEDTLDFWRARIERSKALLAVGPHSLGGRPSDGIPGVGDYFDLVSG